MSATNRSKRFNPNTFTRKVIPILLVVLLFVLLSVVVIVGLSLTGAIAPA